MLGIKVFVRRNVTKDIQVNTLRPETMIEEQLIVFEQVPQPETIVQICLTPAVPVTHQGNAAVFRITKAAAGKRLRRQAGVFFADCELGVIRWRIEVIIAVLIVKNVSVAKFSSGVGQPLEAFPTTSLFRGRQRIRMLPVVTEMGPAGNKNQNAIKAPSLQVAQLFGPLVERCQAVVFC